MAARTPSERRQLTPFTALPGELPLHDQQDLMAYPFFSLSKSKRVVPIETCSGPDFVRVEAALAFGIATIWDADLLIWAGSQLIEAEARGLPTSRRIRGLPHRILQALQRGRSERDYRRLRAALDRLQATTVLTSIRSLDGVQRHRFSWLSEWQELVDGAGRSHGIELVLPDWFYQGVLDQRLILRIDPAYFALTGGIERWLYRIVRKHAGRQPAGWRFSFRQLHAKSGSLARFSDFALDLRRIAAGPGLPGYGLMVERDPAGEEHLSFLKRAP